MDNAIRKLSFQISEKFIIMKNNMEIFFILKINIMDDCKSVIFIFATKKKLTKINEIFLVKFSVAKMKLPFLLQWHFKFATLATGIKIFIYRI